MQAVPPWSWLAMAFVSLLALCFANFSWTTIREIARSRRSSSRTTGTIVGWEEGWLESGSGDYDNGRACRRARLRFRTAKGREVTFVSSHVSLGDRPPRGGHLGVWYPVDEPEKAVVGASSTAGASRSCP